MFYDGVIKLALNNNRELVENLNKSIDNLILNSSYLIKLLPKQSCLMFLLNQECLLTLLLI